MRAYHGTTIFKAAGITDASLSQGLWVTNTARAAARYANAQATGEVDPDAWELGPHAAVVSLEIPSARWREQKSGKSLDKFELYIEHGRVIGVEARECDYEMCSCHAHAAFLRGEFQRARQLASALDDRFGKHDELNIIYSEPEACAMTEEV
jgi:hypothetical protein